MDKVLQKAIQCLCIVFFPLLLCACSEENALYKEATNMMQRPGMVTEPENFPKAKSKLTPDDQYRIYQTLYTEWAGHVFTSLGEYKDAKQLAKEAYYQSGIVMYDNYTGYAQKQLNNPRLFYLEKAYTLFVLAQEYKNAPQLAKECAAIKIEKTLEDATIQGNWENITALFQSFDNTQKEEMATLIYQNMRQTFAANDWGLDEEHTDFTSQTPKKQQYLHDIFLLGIIKNYAPVPPDIQEKMYSAALQRASKPSFWQKDVENHHRINSNAGRKVSTLLQEEIFHYLGDYKDAKLWLKRFTEYTHIPIIHNGDMPKKKHAFAAPEPRTIAIVYTTDGQITDAFLHPTLQANLAKSVGQALKEKTMGNIFFTQDISQASAILYYAISYEHFGTFAYSGGGTADYYHTRAITEIRLPDGTVKLHKSMLNRVTKPQESIGGDFKHVTITMPVPVYDIADTLTILEQCWS